MNDHGYVYYSGGRWNPNAVELAWVIFQHDEGISRRELSKHSAAKLIYFRCGGAAALECAIDQLIERGLIHRDYYKASGKWCEKYVPRPLGDCDPYIVRRTMPSNTVPTGSDIAMSEVPADAANAASLPPHSGGGVS